VWAEAIAFRPPAAVQVCCEKGLAFLDLPSTLVWFDDAGRHQETLDTELPIGQQMLIQFHRAVASKSSFVSDLQETNDAIRILEKAKLSTKESPWSIRHPKPICSDRSDSTHEIGSNGPIPTKRNRV
jgi:hypothetical protein